MKLNSGERIVLKKSTLAKRVFTERKFHEIPILGSHAGVNIYLTNQRIFVELMLLHFKIAEIPLNVIRDIRKEKHLLFQTIIIECRQQSGIRKLVLSLGGDSDLWFRKIQEARSQLR
ncbi:MAG: hypothetical protein Sv326_1249 [Candidatus Fermentimicrarchaeum limneticum]|uniref:GRAM domain-containing protein n=1 Tax=Fermentimicrarchaeum limneticum TaxID=2795018 RepID=A0A7D6BVK9_FERL1|nr:MAG: hypothetical protein Sv326_1249 [Candidatus Fermentimicrarchaeum limneticum]